MSKVRKPLLSEGATGKTTLGELTNSRTLF